MTIMIPSNGGLRATQGDDCDASAAPISTAPLMGTAVLGEEKKMQPPET